MDVRKNPWLKDANRRSMTQVKITSLNLHGTGRRKGFIRPAEIFTTMFKMEVRVGRRRGAEGPYAPVWTQSRTFDEFREFYERLVTTGGANAKEKLTVPFPSGQDGEADVFILLERRDEMELLIQDVVANLDFLLYRPLFTFLGAEAGLLPYLDKLVAAQALVRAYIRRKSVLKELCHKYEDEQRELFHVLSGSGGVAVVAIPPIPYEPNSSVAQAKFRRRILWLEMDKMCYSMSLLCLASENRFRAAKAKKDWLQTDFDSCKYTVIPLCDIAEVRRGPCSRAFRAFPQQSMVDPSLCLVVVGATGTMSIQLVTKSGLERDWLLDALAMMANNSLSHAEARLRGRRWRRYHNVKTLLPVPSNKVKLSQGRLREAAKMKKLLLDVIDVEEEVCEFRGPTIADIAVPVSISERVLWFDQAARRVHLSDDPAAVRSNFNQRSSRGLDIDDIAEIRPGRTAFDIDGSDTEPILCIIGTETVIRLPMDTVKKRNKLIGYFQSFVGMYKNHEFACSDQWAPLYREEVEVDIPIAARDSLIDNEIDFPVQELRPVSDPAVARGGSHSDEAKRRGSHRLAECVEKMQFSPAAENADVAYVPPSGVATDSRRMPAEIMQERGESWSGIVTDGPAPDSAAMAEEQEKPDRLYRAESMPGLSEKPKRSLLQRAGHKVAKRLSFVARRVPVKRGAAPAAMLTENSDALAAQDRYNMLGDTIPEDAELSAALTGGIDDDGGEVIIIDPKIRRKSLSERFLKR